MKAIGEGIWLEWLRIRREEELCIVGKEERRRNLGKRSERGTGWRWKSEGPQSATLLKSDEQPSYVLCKRGFLRPERVR